MKNGRRDSFSFLPTSFSTQACQYCLANITGLFGLLTSPEFSSFLSMSVLLVQNHWLPFGLLTLQSSLFFEHVSTACPISLASFRLTYLSRVLHFSEHVGTACPVSLTSFRLTYLSRDFIFLSMSVLLVQNHWLPFGLFTSPEFCTFLSMSVLLVQYRWSPFGLLTSPEFSIFSEHVGTACPISLASFRLT